MGLLQAYAREAGAELAAMLLPLGCSTTGGVDCTKQVLAALRGLPMLVAFLQPQNLAIPVSVKARVLKMAALYDLPLTTKVVDNEIFAIAKASLPEADANGQQQLDELRAHIRKELCHGVAEDGAATECAAPGVHGKK